MYKRQNVDAALPDVEQVIHWIGENDPVARAAYEAIHDRPRLIGVQSGDTPVFAGVEELLDCHTERADFTLVLELEALTAEQRLAVNDGSAYIAEYNRLLSRWWEQERSSCK